MDNQLLIVYNAACLFFDKNLLPSTITTTKRFILIKKTRPVNLALNTLSFPPMAILSILHRMSGLLLAGLIPLMLLTLSISLHSQASFDQLHQCLTSNLGKFLIWVGLSALMYHLLAGIRHMIMDLGYGEDAHTARKSAWVLFGLAAVVIAAIGVWLW